MSKKSPTQTPFVFQLLTPASDPPPTKEEAHRLMDEAYVRGLTARLHVVAASIDTMIKAGLVLDPEGIFLVHLYPRAISKNGGGLSLIGDIPPVLAEFVHGLKKHVAPLDLVPRLCLMPAQETDSSRTPESIWLALVPKEK